MKRRKKDYIREAKKEKERKETEQHTDDERRWDKMIEM